MVSKMVSSNLWLERNASSASFRSVISVKKAPIPDTSPPAPYTGNLVMR